MGPFGHHCHRISCVYQVRVVHSYKATTKVNNENILLISHPYDCQTQLRLRHCFAHHGDPVLTYVRILFLLQIILFHI